VLLDLREKVKIYNELVLVSINANPPSSQKQNLPSEFLRCCALRYSNDTFEVELSVQATTKPGARCFYWQTVDTLPNDPALWWRMAPLQNKFEKLMGRKQDGTLYSAVRALTGILNKDTNIATPEKIKTFPAAMPQLSSVICHATMPRIVVQQVI